ncbi:MAG: stage IV sporulation protein A, partial [Lachnospiraceae bacterium]|nr:stage IV sporulation protein A [Lachnospiraceae bacterium]
MENLHTGTYDMYKDISARTNGEIYIGIIGAVRTGKSSFIKRFMELMVLPFMEDDNSRQRAVDEMPQAAQGKTIMTTEPKFIPKDAAVIKLGDDTKVRVRLIDCVGYMVDGATGHLENGVERMVKTPWFDYEIPFTKAAEIGTRKVIKDHATIGIVVTADGSFTDIPRENYVAGEEETVKELREIGKPFVMLLNSMKPYSDETTRLAEELRQKYGVSVFPVNCEQLRKEDVNNILKGILFEFPIVRLNFYVPKWIEMLAPDNHIKENVVMNARHILQNVTYTKDLTDYV